MNKRTGFTLIELIVVILILGILAAVAVPRFINLSTQARASALNGLRAAVQSAATLANALQTTSGLASGASISIEGTTVTMLNGYPTATLGGIGGAVRFDTTFTGSGGGPYVFQVAGASTPANCQFTYTAATATAPPAISTSDVSGC